MLTILLERLSYFSRLRSVYVHENNYNVCKGANLESRFQRKISNKNWKILRTYVGVRVDLSLDFSVPLMIL